MGNTPVDENLLKAAQSANLLSQELKNIISASDPLLAEFAMKLLQDATSIEQRLQRAWAKIQNNGPPLSNSAARVGVFYTNKGIARVKANLPNNQLIC